MSLVAGVYITLPLNRVAGQRYTAHWWYTLLVLDITFDVLISLPLAIVIIGAIRTGARLDSVIKQQCADEVSRWSNDAQAPTWLILHPKWEGDHLVATLATPDRQIVIREVTIHSRLNIEQSADSEPSLWFSAVWCEPTSSSHGGLYSICFAGAAFAKVPDLAAFMSGFAPTA